jgi:hypothetical protein
MREDRTRGEQNQRKSNCPPDAVTARTITDSVTFRVYFPVAIFSEPVLDDTVTNIFADDNLVVWTVILMTGSRSVIAYRIKTI